MLDDAEDPMHDVFDEVFGADAAITEGTEEEGESKNPRADREALEARMMESPSCALILEAHADLFENGDLLLKENSDGEPVSWDAFWQQLRSVVLQSDTPGEENEQSNDENDDDALPPPPAVVEVDGGDADEEGDEGEDEDDEEDEEA